jgi:uncharacterized protein (DUF58 family)
MRVRRVAGEVWLSAGFAVVAGIGWWLHSIPLALLGTTGVLVSALFYTWERECLTGVAYRRTLAHDRASFGEVIDLDIEIVNDKLLPLTWLHIEDDFPLLSLEGGSVLFGRSLYRPNLVQVLPMLPFQRIRRRMPITCDRRGLHTIGPARIRSGNPIGYRQRHLAVREKLHLLVFPKIFRLEPPNIVPGIPLGDQRIRGLLGDPSRVSGVRDYRAGDPLRAIDWRATARTGSLLVREFEATASPRIALFADLWVPELKRVINSSELEFLVAVVASVVVDLTDRGISVGLYSSASVNGDQISYPPSSAPGAPGEMLELLAKASPYGAYRGMRFADILLSQGPSLPRGTSAVIVAADFNVALVPALSELCRRVPTTTLWIDIGSGHPPPDGMLHGNLQTRFIDDWKQSDTLELVT